MARCKSTYVSQFIPLETERWNAILTHCRWVQRTKLMTLLFRDGHGSWAQAIAKWGVADGAGWVRNPPGA